VLFTALPLLYVASTAFKPMEELFLFPPRFLVSNPTTRNFSELLIALGGNTVPFLRYFVNSVVVTVTIVALTVIVSSMGAYALVKHKPAGGRVIFNTVLIALMFSPHVTQIPRYLVVNQLGLVNSYAALIMPNIAVAYNIFLMKQFLEQFPDYVIEAARIDGASEWSIYAKIVMPSLTPALSTLIVFSFVNNWNDYFSPLIYITSQERKTLPVALQTIAGGAATSSIGRAGAVAASLLLMTLPTVVIFTFMQKRVMETMVHSGIKG
jgi:ABC-type glycerol-3-phosphate transport system permease component